MYFFTATGHGKRFPARLRNEIQLCDRRLFRRVLIDIAAFRGLAFREECDPATVAETTAA